MLNPSVRVHAMKANIALLATGDEVTQGSILNTNTQAIAHRLFSNGLEPQWNIAVPDDISAIESALDFLAKQHQVIITIGGLGPTSDDKTRFALANYLKEPLVVDTPSFEYLSERYHALNMPFTELSQQQALFPKNAEILKNIHGSANGCVYSQENLTIFMLPGPPRECLPMFDAYILPRLVAQYAHNKELFLWKVFGVAEGKIAEQVDALLKKILPESSSEHYRTSFRWEYPYVDCKVLLDHDIPEKTHIITQLNQLLSPYQLDPNNQKATERLSQYLTHYKQSIFINDHATGGFLESHIHSILNHHNVFFREHFPENSLCFSIHGLDNYWQGQETSSNELTLTTPTGSETFEMPIRKVSLEEYAAEFIAHQIFLYLFSKDITKFGQ